MEVFVLLLSVVTISSATFMQEMCKPNRHYWRPYYGEFSDDGFVATDRGGNTHIAKVIPLDKRSWTVPAQMDTNEIYFAWYPTNNLIHITRFIEILCVEPSDKKYLKWRTISSRADMNIILDKCCPIQAGIARQLGEDRFAYIGRSFRNSTFYVGMVYLEQNWLRKVGMYTMEGMKPVYFENNFEVLTYKCTDQN